MKRLFAIATLLATHAFTKAQTTTFADSAAVYFQELKEATAQHRSLWDLDIYGPVLLVNPSTREIFTNVIDSAKTLTGQGSIFIGTLPKAVNIANTAVRWSGTSWAMVMLPLPKNKQNRINLLTHELFHRSQKQLGFTSYNPDNNHLDQKAGRIALRLELEALKKAIAANDEKQIKKHIADALAFRLYRQIKFDGADSTENLLELNEGICEYTGLMMSGGTKKEILPYFIERIERFIKSPSYVRSFAYETIPVYGYLLSFIHKDWNKQINAKTDLGEFFTHAFAVSYSMNEDAFNTLAKQYNGATIEKEEIQREERIKKQLLEYRNKLVDSPHVELALANMNMSFDYTRMVALEKLGTVYPQIRITDNWGILEVEQGALINTNWNQVNVSRPLSFNGNKVSGEGWKLELKDGYVLEKEGRNYKLKKK
jgi:hypothetical protein